MAAQSNGTVNGFKLPTLKDLTIDNITENVVNFNSQGKDPRMKFILERLVKHLHDFARETRLSTAEWRAGLDWLEDCGHICTGDRKVTPIKLCYSIPHLMEELAGAYNRQRRPRAICSG